MRREADAEVRAVREDATMRLTGIRQAEDDALELVHHARAAQEAYERLAEEYQRATELTRSVQVVNMDGHTFLARFFEEAEHRFRDKGHLQRTDFTKTFGDRVMGAPVFLERVLNRIVEETRHRWDRCRQSCFPRYGKLMPRCAVREQAATYVDQNRRLRGDVDNETEAACKSSVGSTTKQSTYPGMPETINGGLGSGHGGLGLR